MTYGDLKTKVLNLAFPNRMPRNLVARRESHVAAGLVKLQSVLWRLRSSHLEQYDGQEYYTCGGMVVEAPAGEITEVWADRLDAGTEDLPIVGCACRQQYLLTARVNVEALMREYVAEGGAMLDVNGALVQMLPINGTGFFALDRGLLYLYPAAVEPWWIRLKWDGIKQSFEDSDEIEIDEQDQMLLVRWCEAQGEMDERNWSNASKILEVFAGDLRDAVRRHSRQDNPMPRRAVIQNRLSDLGFYVKKPCCQANTYSLTNPIASDPYVVLRRVGDNAPIQVRIVGDSTSGSQIELTTLTDPTPSVDYVVLDRVSDEAKVKLQVVVGVGGESEILLTTL